MQSWSALVACLMSHSNYDCSDPEAQDSGTVLRSILCIVRVPGLCDGGLKTVDVDRKHGTKAGSVVLILNNSHISMNAMSV